MAYKKTALLLFTTTLLLSAYSDESNQLSREKASLYDILGIPHDAETRNIIKAFRKQALAYHPDKNPHNDTTAIMQQINDAYEVLSDPESRKEYDASLQPLGHTTLMTLFYECCTKMFVMCRE